MDKKTEAMISLYKQCLDKGYTDMSDPTQLIKVKVIATDLKLRYPADKKMQDFLSEAQACYEEEEAAKKEKAEKLKKEREAERQEQKRRAVDGELLLTFSKTDSSVVKIYRRPDESIYYTIGDSAIKHEGSPKITIEKSNVNAYTYNPSQTVYTGATVGGITTGGFHETGDSISVSSSYNGKGYITCDGGEVTKIVVSDSVNRAFRRLKEYQLIAIAKVIQCRREGENIYDWAVKGAIGKGDAYGMVSAASFAADERRKDYSECVKIANFITKVITHNYPESDESIYIRALKLSMSDELSDVLSACDLLDSISDYKNASKQKRELAPKIEELKEKQIIEKEANAKKAKKKALIWTPIICACIAFIIVLNTVIIPKNEYAKMTDYASSAIGDHVYFGTYEQDNKTSNGKENIEWIVLAKEDNKILVISEKGIDCQQYNTLNIDITWKTCSLRKWMNGTFLNDAFSAEEQVQIQNTTVSADKNPKYDTYPGNDTTDKVFLMSITEVEKYFSSNEDRNCVPTAYAIAQGAQVSDDYTKDGAATCWWWLRSPGDDLDSAAYVSSGGSVRDGGRNVDDDYVCVRPALWINLDS